MRQITLRVSLALSPGVSTSLITQQRCPLLKTEAEPRGSLQTNQHVARACRHIDRLELQIKLVEYRTEHGNHTKKQNIEQNSR